MRPVWLCAFIAALLMCAASGAGAAGKSDGPTSPTRTITDMVGRKVEIPAQINKVYCTSPVGSILVYSLAPEKLAGWNYSFTPEERTFVAEPYRDLPILGGWFGKGNSGNIEEILSSHPDVIFSMGTTDTMSITLSERLQTQSSVPVLMMGGALTHLDDAYLFAGKVLGTEARAAELADYCTRTIADARRAAASIPRDKRVRVYYAEGPKGLQTDPAGSYHTEILDLVGAVNVADVPGGSGYGRVTISLEQLIAWNPEVIITGYEYGQRPDLGLARLTADPAWNQLAAVKKRQVYETPHLPFNWFDRPPSVNRILGIRWMGNLLYPEVFRGDLRQETRDFYAKFYHTQLTDAQLNALLKDATRGR
ncbi:ABC transporter substrate-binding protein [candidate division BRC1 bacterium HGW-BRC1-1]|nr:MAG: ABC transporter substrate-binding protein [candidate division BRC1 bacterium HGW-BRC1-1]